MLRRFYGGNDRRAVQLVKGRHAARYAVFVDGQQLVAVRAVGRQNHKNRLRRGYAELLLADQQRRTRSHGLRLRRHIQIQVLAAPDVPRIQRGDGSFVGEDLVDVQIDGLDGLRRDLRRRDGLRHDHRTVQILLVLFLLQLLRRQPAGAGIDAVNQPILAHKNQPLRRQRTRRDNVRIDAGNHRRRNCRLGNDSTLRRNCPRRHPVCRDGSRLDLLHGNSAGSQLIGIHRTCCQLVGGDGARVQLVCLHRSRRQLVGGNGTCRNRIRRQLAGNQLVDVRLDRMQRVH